MRGGKWLSVLLISGLILAGCGKEDKNPTGPEQEQPVPPQIATISGPNSQNTPAPIRGTVSMMNGLIARGQTFIATLGGVEATRSGDSFVWTYSNGQESVTVISTPGEDGADWQVKVTGVYDSVQVQNFVALKGFSANDGKNGWWEAYDPATGQKQARYEWTTGNDNTVHATLEVYGDETIKYEVTNKADGSGTLVVYRNDVKTLQASWQADGSGSYTMWDDNGNVVGQGNWT